MTKYKYIGAPCYVSKCQFNGNRSNDNYDDFCRSGGCIGLVCWECPYKIDGNIITKFKGMFKEVDD